MHFGDLFRQFRERRGLSLRELGKISEIDHSYIHRLESGDKSAPSDEVITALTRALKLSAKEREVVDLLIGNELPESLIVAGLASEEFDSADIQAAANMSFRGSSARTEEGWRDILQRVTKMRRELSSAG